MFTTTRRLFMLSCAVQSRRAASRRPALMLALTAFVASPCALALTGCGGSGTSASLIPSGSATGTTGTSGTSGATGTTPAAGKGVISLTFSSPSGTNADTSAFQTSTAGGGLGLGAAGLNNLTVAGSAQSGSGLRVAQIILDTSGTAVVNTPYSANSQASTLAGTISLTQTPISGTSVGTPSVWLSSGGTIYVDSITGKTYKLRLVDVTMIKGEGDDSASMGSFTLNGTATVTVP